MSKLPPPPAVPTSTGILVDAAEIQKHQEAFRAYAEAAERAQKVEGIATGILVTRSAKAVDLYDFDNDETIHRIYSIAQRFVRLAPQRPVPPTCAHCEAAASSLDGAEKN